MLPLDHIFSPHPISACCRTEPIRGNSGSENAVTF
jgi:hypothetical protein